MPSAAEFGETQKIITNDFFGGLDNAFSWILSQNGNIHESNLVSNQITFIYALRRL